MTAFSRRTCLVSLTGLALAAPRTIAGAQTATTLRIGCSPREPMSQAMQAQATGLFAQHGITAQIQTMQSGAVVGGALDIGCSNSVALAQTHMHAIPITVIVPGGIHDARYPTTQCVVAASSSYTSPRQFNGQNVGVASLAGLEHYEYLPRICATARLIVAHRAPRL